MYRDLTEEEELQLAVMIEEKVPFLEARKRLPHARIHELRTLWVQYTRSVRSGRLRPIPEDLDERIKWVQSQWSPQEWGARWVGRWANRRDTNLQQAASRMLQ